MVSLPDNVRQALLQLAQESDCLIIGELHGTQEIPQLVAALRDDLTALGYGGLAYETPMAEQEAAMQWASGASAAVPAFFHLPPSDGRPNKHVLALLGQVAETGWQILFFDADDDQKRETWQERDRTMADNLTAQWQQFCPDRKIVAVCGNLHSRLTNIPGFYDDLWPSFAACFQERNPQRVVRSVMVVFHGGSFYNIGVKELHGGEPLAEAKVREDTTQGHYLALHLPQATPATFLTPPTD